MISALSHLAHDAAIQAFQQQGDLDSDYLRVVRVAEEVVKVSVEVCAKYRMQHAEDCDARICRCDKPVDAPMHMSSFGHFFQPKRCTCGLADLLSLQETRPSESTKEKELMSRAPATEAGCIADQRVGVKAESIQEK